MERVGQRPLDLGQERQLVDGQRRLAAARLRGTAFGPDDVAEVEVDRPRPFLRAEQLDPARPVDKIQEDELPHVPPAMTRPAMRLVSSASCPPRAARPPRGPTRSRRGPGTASAACSWRASLRAPDQPAEKEPDEERPGADGDRRGRNALARLAAGSRCGSPAGTYGGALRVGGTPRPRRPRAGAERPHRAQRHALALVEQGDEQVLRADRPVAQPSASSSAIRKIFFSLGVSGSCPAGGSSSPRRTCSASHSRAGSSWTPCAPSGRRPASSRISPSSRCSVPM